MNRQEKDILMTLADKPFVSQRSLAESSGYSIGVVNQSLKNLVKEGFLSDDMQLTKKADHALKEGKPQNAIILAAGFGMRMVPINHEMPKALVEVHGEPLIERTIRMLREAGVHEIHLVAGFMKEQLEYLIDDFGADLIINEEYAQKNSLHSLALAAQYIDNTYIIPCDLWCEKNLFRERELYSWYMVSDACDPESRIRVNRKKELVKATGAQMGNQMVGISYLTGETAQEVKKRLRVYDQDPRYQNAFWEETLYDADKMILQARTVPETAVTEINTYEQLRELDEDSNNLRTDAIDIIMDVFDAGMRDIKDITILKKGMTNRSFLFTCKDRKYIMRIPGEGTDQLINRREEAEVYQAIADNDLCDSIVYINPENGYKITEYYEDTRVCDPNNIEDLKLCMQKLKQFHGMNLKVSHTFPLFDRIEYYESLWDGTPSGYRDYGKTKENVFSLQPYIQEHADNMCLTHIDAVPDNFLFVKKGEQEELRLIDWEYAAMQDPHIDIAMFCIYAMYDRAHVEQLIDLYFEDQCPQETRIKIYCYIAACGLLWSNWCEYKRILGVEFGAYSLRQYRYAKEYYKIVKEALEEEK